MILLDFRSKKYCLLLPRVRSDFFFTPHGLVNRVPPLRSVWLGSCDVPRIYSDHLTNCLPLSVLTKHFSVESVLPIMCPKYFSFLIVATVFRDYLDSLDYLNIYLGGKQSLTPIYLLL